MRGRLAVCAAAILALGTAAAQETPDSGPITGRSGLDQRPGAPMSADRTEAPRSATRAVQPPAAPDASDAARPPAPVREAAASVRVPTLYPRLLPAADRHGEAFADRVSISPDGRRLAVGSQDGRRYAVQLVGVTRKTTERTLRGRGTLEWVGWADDGTVLLGTREANGAQAVAAYDVASGRARVLGTARGGPSGVLTVLDGGTAVLATDERPALACANGARPPRQYDGTALRVAGPPDARGRLILRGEADGRGVLVPFDCADGTLGAPLHEGAAPDGLIVNPALRRYEGVWTAEGPRYFDQSLEFEMEEVAASFPEPVDVYPIETTRSPNTMLLYVVGDTVPGGYYVLDRYAGDLDLHVTYRSDGAARTN